MFCGVVSNASLVSAALIATFSTGSFTSARSGAQDSVDTSAPAGSPLIRRPEASGAASGERQPVPLMYGWVRSCPASSASWAGHDVAWDAATTPSDCQPMLMLVPTAT